MADGNLIAEIGHNGAPVDPFDAHQAHIDDLYTEAQNWCDGADIENAAQAAVVDRLISDFKDAITAAETSRDEEKKPHADKVNEIQTKYYPLVADTKAITGKAVRAKKALLAVKTKWATEEAKRQHEAAEKLRKEAEEKAAAAAQAARDALGDLGASEAAEALVIEAKAELKAADKAATTTIKGMRDNWVVAGLFDTVEYEGQPMSGRGAMLRHYMKTRPDDLFAACLELARQEVRDGRRSIPGVLIENQRRAF